MKKNMRFIIVGIFSALLLFTVLSYSPKIKSDKASILAFNVANTARVRVWGRIFSRSCNDGCSSNGYYVKRYYANATGECYREDVTGVVTE